MEETRGTPKHGQLVLQREGAGMRRRRERNVEKFKEQDEAGSRKKKLFQQESLNYAWSSSFGGAGGRKRIVLHICVRVLALMTHLSAFCT